eukprot:gene18145-30398_t
MDPKLTTMNTQEVVCRDEWTPRCRNWTLLHPWRAPGSTAGLDACGVAGGAFTNMSYRAGGFGPQTGHQDLQWNREPSTGATASNYGTEASTHHGLQQSIQHTVLLCSARVGSK